MTGKVGIWSVGESAPVRARRSKVDLESSLEDWIAADSSLLGAGLRIVGRQVRLDAGPLDLLAIDPQGRWIVIELKRERLYREAVAQVIDYVACLHAIDGPDLLDKLEAGLGAFGDAAELKALVVAQAEAEAEERDVAAMLVGTGVDAGLERVVDYLGRYQLPVSVVTFEVFDVPSGGQLLVRDVIEEQVEAPTGPKRQRSLEAIRAEALNQGVEAAFDRLVRAAEDAGLHVRPYTQSVMVTPRTQKNRYLMAFGPRPGGRMWISFNPDPFEELLDGISAQDVVDAMGDAFTAAFAEEPLEALVAQFEQFLSDLPDQTNQSDRPTADRPTVLMAGGLIQAGEWTTYGDISRAVTGFPSSAMTIGNIVRSTPDFPNAHRVLASTGRIPSRWISTDGGPEVCRARLEAEGIAFDGKQVADPVRRLPVEVLRSRLDDRSAGQDSGGSESTQP